MPSTTSFAQVFGGNTLYPALANYQNLQLTTSVTLTWPTEQQIAGQSVVSSIIDVTASLPNLTVTLPSAQLVSPGYVIIFNNLGANAVTVLSALGNTLLNLPPGQVWTLYLADNSIPQGTWRIYQQGAATSIANSASLAGAGLRAVGSLLNQVLPVNEQTANYTVQVSDQAAVIVWLGGTGTLTLPAPSVTGSSWFSAVKNLGTGTLTLSPVSGQIDLASTKSLNAQDSLFIGSDGTQYFTIGFGRAVASTFGFVSINVAGTGTFVLSGAQLNQVSYRFTGALTGTRTIQVPSAVQQYWIDNETSGAFSLFIATSTQSPGISVGQGQQAILFCDGTNVLTANSSAVTFPISPVNGGTGQSAVALGDLLYGNATNSWARLPGTASGSKVFLSQTGTGLVSAAPAWTGLLPTDLGSGPASVSTFLRGNQVWSTLGASDLGAGVANNSVFLRGDQTWSSTLNGTLVLNPNLGSDGLDINLNSAPGTGWGINLFGSINTDARGIQIINTNAGSAAGTVGLVVGNNGGNQLLVGKTGASFAGTKFINGPVGEVSYFWSGGSVPTVLAYGPGGSPTAAVVIGTTGIVNLSSPTVGTLLELQGVSFAGIDGSANLIFGGLTPAQAASTKIFAGGRDTIDLSNSGNVVFNPPSSGITATVNGASGSTSLQVNAPNTTSNSFGIGIFAGTNINDFAFVVANAAQNANFLKVFGDGHVTFPSITTTASAANAFLDNTNNNNLLRSTSSIRYKRDIRNIDAERALAIVKALRVVAYRSKAAADDPMRVHYGLIAEQVAEVDRSLVNFDEHGAPDGVQYDRVAMLLLPVVQRILEQWPTSPH